MSIGTKKYAIVMSTAFLVMYLTIIIAGTAWSAEREFPAKELTIIVNFSPGGGRDILARGLAKTMTRYLGVPIVVANMPGAGGARGLIALTHSKPDGYTIAVGGPGEIVDQIMQQRDYDNKKLAYIGLVQSAPLFFFVKGDSPFRSIKDFKTLGKPARHSTNQLTNQTAVASMILASRENFPLAMVGGYAGAAEALLALIRGEVEFTGGPYSLVQEFLKSGQIRGILTFHDKRAAELPDVPTVAEIGHPDLTSLSQNLWFVAPPGTPKQLIGTLETALLKTLKDPEFVTWAKKSAIEPGNLNGEETEKMVLGLFGYLEKYKGEIAKYIKK